MHIARGSLCRMHTTVYRVCCTVLYVFLYHVAARSLGSADRTSDESAGVLAARHDLCDSSRVELLSATQHSTRISISSPPLPSRRVPSRPLPSRTPDDYDYESMNQTRERRFRDAAIVALRHSLDDPLRCFAICTRLHYNCTVLYSTVLGSLLFGSDRIELDWILRLDDMASAAPPSSPRRQSTKRVLLRLVDSFSSLTRRPAVDWSDAVSLLIVLLCSFAAEIRRPAPWLPSRPVPSRLPRLPPRALTGTRSALVSGHLAAFLLLQTSLLCFCASPLLSSPLLAFNLRINNFCTQVKSADQCWLTA